MGGGTAIENPGHQSNLYEYRDQPTATGQSEKGGGKLHQTSAMMHTRTPSTSTAVVQESTPSIRTGSASSLKDSVNGYPSGDTRPPQPLQRSAMPVPANRTAKTAPSRTHLEGGVPQTSV